MENPAWKLACPLIPLGLAVVWRVRPFGHIIVTVSGDAEKHHLWIYSALGFAPFVSRVDRSRLCTVSNTTSCLGHSLSKQDSQDFKGS